MRDLPPPFRFDIGAILTRARGKLRNRIGAVSINLPFVSFSVEPDDLERKVAREIVIRLADRRVLNAFECCDNCIDQALASLQEIRSILVDKQVELARVTDAPLYLLTELMLEPIRQFLTFEQRLRDEATESRLVLPDYTSSRRPYHEREKYFGALEMLRAHLHRCLVQVAKIADVEIPKISAHMRYDERWQLEAYESPKLAEGTA